MLKNSKNKIIAPKKKDYGNNKFSVSLTENLRVIKNILNDEDMIVYRMINSPDIDVPEYCLIFSDALSSEDIIDDKIIRPIMRDFANGEDEKYRSLDYMLNRVIECREVEKSADFDKMISSVLYGDTIFLMDGAAEALIINTKQFTTRGISEPESERVVRGPKEGFTESIKVNISLLERKIKNPALKFKYIEIGTITRTKACICYVEDIASDKIIKEVEKRLNDIEIDGIMDSGYIQQMIKDAPLSIFDTIGDTERPDIVAAKLLEGRVAVICDGSPSVLTMPHLFLEYFQSNEDYYQNYVFASINRLLRLFALFFTTSIPAIYLAIVTYHQEMLPTPLILSITTARQDVPFPTVVELILMLLVFEVMREAGIRLPQSIGMAISIVGALVLGEAAVAAKFISAPMVIITAFTGIASFLVYRLKVAVIILRLFSLIAASFLGLFGYMMAVMLTVAYLLSIRSFGVPYMLNSSFIDENSIKDMNVRAPLWLMNYRPKFAKGGVRTPVKVKK